MTTPRELIEDLESVGIKIQDLSDLVNMKGTYPAAIPVLLDWLAKIETVPAQDRGKLREMLVRSLSVPKARGVAGPQLVDEFRQVEDPTGLGARWVIANALSVVADESIFDDLVELASDPSYGRGREMLMLAIAQTKDARAVQALVRMLDDNDLSGHAIAALGKLRAREARPEIERFLAHPEPWVRTEAKRALARMP